MEHRSITPLSSSAASLRLLFMCLSAAGLVVLEGCSKEHKVSCQPTTCEAEGWVCGALDDGCGNIIECGTCDGVVSACDSRTGQCVCLFQSCDDGCCREDERCSSGHCVPKGWYGVDIESVRAPDEYSVEITLTGDPGVDLIGTAESYAVTSTLGDLEVAGIEYDAERALITLTTGKQKLGVTYRVGIDTGPDGPGELGAVFPSADTAVFWLYDFSDPNFSQYTVTAERAAIGSRSVAYIEQGQSAYDTAETIQTFDNEIYPVLTQSYHEAPDIDGNERIVLVGVNGGDYYGGYFSPVDAYPDELTMEWWGLHSNEKEIVNINLVVETWFAVDVLPHEFSHLLYHERHGLSETSWDYHDEGLAECAVHIVNGVNAYAVEYFQEDPNGLIANGLSMVHWTWGLYENYTMAYLFWIYLASRAGGLDALGEIFDLDSGAPWEVNGWIAARLGSDFPTVQREQLIAAWLQEAEGHHGYEGLLSFPARSIPVVPAGTASVDLDPFAAVLFRLAEASVDYPTTQGPNIVYTGVDSAGTVDSTPPFDIGGGVLLVHNESQAIEGWSPEHSGPDLLSVGPITSPMVAPMDQSGLETPFSAAWLDPPPFNPERMDMMRSWQKRRREALVRMATHGYY